MLKIKVKQIRSACYTRKTKEQLKREQKLIDICLNCDKPNCIGTCNKIRGVKL